MLERSHTRRRAKTSPHSKPAPSINLLYCGDRNMRDGLLISVLSLTKHTRTPLHVFVLTAKVSTSTREFLPLRESDVEPVRELISKHNPQGSLSLVDITDLFEAQPPVANMETRFTPLCTLRLYADELECIPDRILYLDTDIVCHKPFEQFYNQNLDGVELAAVLDYYGRWFFRQRYSHMLPDYFNSGVLLLNMAEIRRTGLFARCREMCENKWMFMPDQSALNKCVRSKVIASHRYNDQRRFHSNTVFQHFTTSFRLFPWFHAVSVKPWQVEEVHSTLHLHEYDDLLEEFEQHRAAQVQASPVTSSVAGSPSGSTDRSPDRSFEHPLDHSMNSPINNPINSSTDYPERIDENE
ncbi:MAG TPA: glycosyltransferase family 8 protein [Aeriscardovia aeriphila]|uniref:Glycosyltransferase family 8 protein n=1 Tax=Aeriscardovia aeriphila TaxID=218139 RepID=A0A921FUG5_9BIFI|nr:glycosyltransferase family 8 protein [Aeriscardovia aeriphila]